MNQIDRNQIIVSAILVAINVILFNVILGQFRPARLDLTEGQVFSLSETTERILQSLQEPVEILAYISEDEAMSPDIRPLLPELRDLLDEYEARGDGRVQLRYIVPEDNEVAETEARTNYGIRPEIGLIRDDRREGIQAYYLSLVVKYPGTDTVTINANELIARNLLRAEQRLELKNVELAVTKAIKKAVLGFESKRNIFKKFPSELQLITFFSPMEALPEKLREGAAEILKKIDELAANSEGKIVHQVADLSNQNLLEKYRPTGFLVGDSDQALFLSLVVQMEGQASPISLIDFEGLREASWVEETIMAQVKRSSPGLLRRIGIAEHYPPLDQRGRQPHPPAYAALSRLIAKDHEVVNIDLSDLRGLPADLDLLLVMEPRELPESAAYVLDQYVMAGGKVIFAMDRTESSGFARATPGAKKRDTGLEGLLATWGVDLQDGVLLDPSCGDFFQDRGEGKRPLQGPFRSLVEVGFDAGGVNRDLAFMKSFEAARFWFPGALSLNAVEGLSSNWLLKSSQDSYLRAAKNDLVPDLAIYPDAAFAPPTAEETEESRILAAIVEGTFPSHWAGKKAPVLASEPDPEGERLSISETPVAKSRPTSIVVIANGEFLDLFQAEFSRQVGSKFSLFPTNMAFLANTMDWLLEDNDLAAIRNRGRSFRPLERLSDDQMNRTILWNFVAVLLALSTLGSGLYMARRARRPLI